MTLADDLTVLILTSNEADNIARCLAAVDWAPAILVIDSGSTDATADIVARHPRARIVTRAFDSFAGQCNFGLACIDTEWVLSMDADYVLSPGLVSELRAHVPPPETAGFMARFVYCIHGVPLRSTLYPPRTVLYRRARARYRDAGHGHRVDIDGHVDRLRHAILHDDRKPLSRWFAAQQAYAAREADHLLSAQPGELRPADRIRLMMWPAPLLMLIYVLIAKGGVFDGWAGLYYALQRSLAEAMIALRLVEKRVSARP